MTASHAAGDLLRELRRQGETVSATYPYAALLGRWLAADEPDWWLDFETADPEASTLPLAQARHYAFLAFCERRHDSDRLDERLARYITAGPRHLHDELHNTVVWYRRHG